MIGVVIGAIGAIGIAKLIRHQRRGCGGHHAHWHHGRHRRGPGGHRGSNRWGFVGLGRLGHFLDELGASPEQERAIRDHVRAFRRKVEPMADEGYRTRDDLAAAFRGESFDEIRAGEMFARHDDVIRELRREAVGLMAQIHAVLDEEQRKALASFVESRRGPFGGPYRGAV